MRNSWIEKYHQPKHTEEQSDDAFNAFIELSETPDVHFDENKAWDKVSSRLEIHNQHRPTRSKVVGIRTLYKVAAVITLLIISFVVYQSTSEKQGQLVKITTSENSLNHELPDGSLVYLDSYSTVAYNEDFAERTIEFSGTGFYDVRNSGSTFTVIMGELEVKVLGTVFTLESTASDFKTYVEEGEVQVSDGTEVFKINPGELLIYEKEDNEFTLTKNTDQNILSWKTGKFIFKNTSLPEVLKNLERHYKIQFQNQSKFNSCVVTAEFNQQELSEVLSILSEVLDLKFTTSGSIVKILGKGCN